MSRQTSFSSWKTYIKELEGIMDFCKKTKSDWPICFTGIEGAGKSTLAAQTALILDKEFSFDVQVVDSLKEYIAITKKYKNTPYKAILLDEAVKLFFNRDFANRANSILTKLFISNRSFQQFNLITIPSIFYLDKYIREWRMKTLTYCWIDPYSENYSKRYFAYYSRKSYRSILMSHDARMAMLDRERFIRQYKPDFICPFKPLQNRHWEKYDKIKFDNQMKLLDEAMTETLKLEDAKKIGFNRHTPHPQFLRWLISHFGTENPINKKIYLRFTQEFAAAEAMTAKSNINYLVNKMMDKGFIGQIGRAEFLVTAKGDELVKIMQGDEVENNPK